MRMRSLRTMGAGRFAVLLGLVVLALAAVLVMAPALMRLGGWVGGGLVLLGALLLAAGIAVLSGPAHAEHVADRRRRSGGTTRGTR